MTMSRPKIEIRPTRADRALEWAGWAMLILLWALVLFHFPGLPDTIPTHFNAAGEPDDYGSRAMLFMLPAIATALTGGMTALNRFPHLFNHPAVITTENAARHYRGATRLIRFLKLAVSTIFTLIVHKTVQTATGGKGGLGASFLPLTICLMLIPVLVFALSTVRNNRRGVQ